MSVYRSLIFREFRVTRRTVILRLILILLIVAVFILPLLMGVFSDPESGEAEDLFSLYLVLPLLAGTAGILASFDTGIYKSDVNTGWARYSCVLPVTARQKAGAMLAAKLILMAAAFVILLIAPAAVSAAKTEVHIRESFMITLNSYLAVFAAGLVISSVQLAFIIQARDKDSMKKLGIIAGVIGLGLFELASNVIPDMNNGEGVSESKIAALFRLLTKFRTTLVLAGVLAALFAVSFFITLKALGRREP